MFLGLKSSFFLFYCWICFGRYDNCYCVSMDVKDVFMVGVLLSSRLADVWKVYF